MVLSDTWLNLHKSIIALFTILPPWPLWSLEPAHSTLPYRIPTARNCGCSGNTSCAACLVSLPQPGSAVVQPRCTVIFRGTTLLFFLPSCGFCATINLISSDLASECFPCNLATPGRCEALLLHAKNWIFPARLQVLTTGCNTTTNTRDSAVRRCIFKPWK